MDKNKIADIAKRITADTSRHELVTLIVNIRSEILDFVKACESFNHTISDYNYKLREIELSNVDDETRGAGLRQTQSFLNNYSNYLNSIKFSEKCLKDINDSEKEIFDFLRNHGDSK